MNKSSFITLFLFLISHLSFAVVLNPPIKSTNLIPSNTVIMFDVDDVLIKRGFWESWEEYWHIIRDCNFFDVVKFIGWHLLHVSSLADNLYNRDIHAYLDELAQEWPFLQQETAQGTILARIKRAITASKPIARMQEILLTLHDQGYPITLATNQTFSTLRRIIDVGNLPDYSYYTLIFTSDRCEPSNPILIRKPHKEYYQCFKKVLAQTGLTPAHYIFIDDRYKNVVNSAKEGIISIHVNNYERDPAQKLIDDLRQLGIIVQDTPAKEKGREKNLCLK